ncbi:MAG: hypothetical protein ABW164_01055 [Sphingobium sp.]
MAGFFRWSLIALVAGVAGFATPASAMSAPSTRLVSCVSGDCLQVSGHRADRNAPVTFNGRPIAVEGERRWQFSLPVSTLRLWCEPNVRAVSIGVDGAETRTRLPIGMMVRPHELTMLVIRTK